MKHFLCIILLSSSHLLYSQSSRINLSGKVKFVSDAPLEIIKAESEKLTGIIDFASNSFAFTVNLKSFECFNSALQKEHFHENYLESEDYPAITYTGKVLDKIDWTQDGTYEVRTKGKLIYTV